MYVYIYIYIYIYIYMLHFYSGRDLSPRTFFQDFFQSKNRKFQPTRVFPIESALNESIE